VEVKTTAKLETGKISNKMVESYKRFAAKYKLPLLFASRVELYGDGLWILQTVDEFERNGRAANIELYPKTSGFVLLDDFMITVETPFELDAQYSREFREGAQHHPGLGYLTGLVAHTNEPITLYATSAKDAPASISFSDFQFLKLFFDRFQAPQSTRHCEYGVSIIKTVPRFWSKHFSGVLVTINRYLLDSDGVAHGANPSRLLAKIENGYNGYFTRTRLIRLIHEINARAQAIASTSLFGNGELGEPADREKHLDMLFPETAKKFAE